MSRASRAKSKRIPPQPSPPAPRGPSRRADRTRPLLIAVTACLFFSGTASLMLEVVWTRLLRLIFGSTTLAVSTILVAYMLGLGLGGFVGGRLAARQRNGIRTYGWIEISIAGYAVLVPWLLSLFPLLNRAVLSSFGFWPAALGRFVVVLVVLLLPTLLMGATLPVLVAALVRERSVIASRVGLLYGLNTFGAVGGVMLSTFYFLPIVGVRLTNLTAATLDLFVGVITLRFIAPQLRTQLAPGPTAAAAPERRPAAAPAKAIAPLARWNPALLAYAVVGFTALAYEVCWTRALALVLGSSIYAFATMLAAFLTGIALGSLVARRWGDGLRHPLAVYGAGLGVLGLSAVATLLLFSELPGLFVEISARFGLSRVSVVSVSIGLSMLVMLAPTLVLGALFPILVRALASERDNASDTVGDVYFVNTLGSAAGAFAAGFFLLPVLGLQMTLAYCLAANLVVAAVVLLWQSQWTGRWRTLSAVSAIAMAVVLVAFPPSWNRAAMTRGLYRDPSIGLDVGIELLPLSGVSPENLLYYRDGINSTVSVHYDFGEYSLRVNGKADASSSQDMSTQVLLGELGFLFGPRAERVMVIGLASGITVGSVALHDPERVDVIELEPAMIDASHFFDTYNNHPLEHPNVRVIADDGRNYIEYTREHYDVIISEPSNPWVTGASNLFTREFFHAAHAALRPGGRLVQWVQLYALDPPALRAIIAALHAEFPYIYGFAQESGQPDVMLLASDTALQRADFSVWENLSEPVRDDLRRINTFSTADVWSLLRFTPSDLQAIADASPVRNTDDNMFVELRAPWALHDDDTGSANWEVLNGHSTDAVTLLEQIGPRLDAETIGEIALSYVSVRQDQRLAGELVRVASARGGSAHALTAQAALRLQEDSTATEEAQQLLDRAVELRPDLFAPRLQRARLHALADEAAAALQDADAALAAAPGDLRARYVRMQALNALGRSTEVYQEAQALLNSPYGTLEPQVLLEAAGAAAATGHYDEGIRELRKYLEGHLNSGSEWQLLAGMYDSTGQTALAQEARDNAERAQRNVVLSLQRSALRKLRFGNTNDAIRYLRAALLFDSTYEPARRELRHLGVSSDAM